MKIKLNKTYIILTLLLLLTEVLIAVFVKTGFIRHTFGDYLVVILLYTFVKSFFDAMPLKLVIAVLLFSFLIEVLQLCNLLNLINQQNNTLLKIVLGSTFHYSDLIAYTLGAVTILIFEYKLYKLWKF